MKNKKQLEQDNKDQKTARNVIFVLGWTALTLISALVLKSIEYPPKIYILFYFILMILIGWFLWKIINKEKKNDIN